mgnify:CR=1 FL=1
MGFLDKILKKKQKSNETNELLDTIEDFDDIYSSNDNSLNSNKSNSNNDEIDLDTMDLGDDEDDKPKSKKQLPKLNLGLEKNSKKTKTIAGVVIVGLSLYLASPFIMDTLKTQGIMSNSEYEETIQEVNELSSQNDNPELLAKMEAEEKDRIEKAKAAREAKKLKKEQEAKANQETKSNETTSNEIKEESTQSEQAELVRKQEVSITNSLTKKEEVKTKRPQTLAIIEQLALTRLKELNVDHTTIVGDYLLNSYIDKYNDLKMKYEFSISKFDYLILDSLEAKAH